MGALRGFVSLQTGVVIVEPALEVVVVVDGVVVGLVMDAAVGDGVGVDIAAKLRVRSWTVGETSKSVVAKSR